MARKPPAAAATDVTQSNFAKSGDEMKAADPKAHYKCLRNAEDGSIYYGEVAYIRKSNGQMVKTDTPAFEAEIAPLSDADRVEAFEMIRQGNGL